MRSMISCNEVKSQVLCLASGLKSEPGVVAICFEAGLVYIVVDKTGLNTETLSKRGEGVCNKMAQW